MTTAAVAEPAILLITKKELLHTAGPHSFICWVSVLLKEVKKTVLETITVL